MKRFVILFVATFVLAVALVGGGFFDGNVAEARTSQNEDPGGGGVGTMCTSYPDQLNGATLYLASPPAPLSPGYFHCQYVGGYGYEIWSHYYQSYFFQPPGDFYYPYYGWADVGEGQFFYAWTRCPGGFFCS